MWHSQRDVAVLNYLSYEDKCDLSITFYKAD